MNPGFVCVSVVKASHYIYFKTSSANYQLLKHLKMISEPLSPQQKRRLLKVGISTEIQTHLPRLKNPNGLTEHSTNPLGKIKDKLCQQIT